MNLYLRETHDKKYDDEPDFYQMLDLKDKVKKLEKALREILPYIPCGRVRRIGYDALGDEPNSTN